MILYLYKISIFIINSLGSGIEQILQNNETFNYMNILTEKNISVNSIAPGMVDTKLVKNAKEISNKQLDIDKKKYLLGKKYLSINEVKSQILYLLSNSSKRITGHTLLIDAGFLLK